MNITAHLSLLTLICLSLAHAEVPEVVLSRLKTDMTEGMRSYPNLTDEMVNREWNMFQQQLKDPAGGMGRNFVFTDAETEAFAAGKAPPSDDDLKNLTDQLTAIVPFERLPRILDYYEKLRSTNKITAQQRVLYLRTSRAILTVLKAQAGKEVGKP